MTGRNSTILPAFQQILTYLLLLISDHKMLVTTDARQLMVVETAILSLHYFPYLVSYNVKIVTTLYFIYTIVLHPVIAESPKNVIAPLLSTAIFKCIGQGYGFVWVVWEKRNTDSPLPSKTNIITTYSSNNIISTLTIPIVQVEDEGLYQCAYVNSKGITYSYFARLDIGSKSQLIDQTS